MQLIILTLVLNEETLPENACFQPALSTNSGLKRAQADKRQAIFQSLERRRAQLRQALSWDPFLSTLFQVRNLVVIPYSSRRPLDNQRGKRNQVSLYFEESKETFVILEWCKRSHWIKCSSEFFFCFPQSNILIAATCIAYCFFWFSNGQRPSLSDSLLLSCASRNAEISNKYLSPMVFSHVLRSTTSTFYL